MVSQRIWYRNKTDNAQNKTTATLNAAAVLFYFFLMGFDPWFFYYVISADGNYVPEEFGFGYIKALAQNFYGIEDVAMIILLYCQTFARSMTILFEAMIASLQEILRLSDAQLDALLVDFESRLPEYLRNALHTGQYAA